jgi:hypothetical protein
MMQLSRKKKILVYLASAVLIAVILEGGTRLYLRKSQGYSGGPLLQYVFDPYKNVLPTPNWVDTRGVKHNGQGFRRSADVSLRKPEGTFRVFLMGGSTAYGTGGLWPHIQRTYPVIKNSQTIDAYLERDLGKRFPGTRFEVINAAIPSIWTHHHLIYLNQTILKYQPDMVVLLDGYNDFYQTQKDHDQFGSYSYQEHSRVIMGDPTLRSLAYTNAWWLGRKSAFVHVLMRRARVVKQLFRSYDRTPMNVPAALAALREIFPKNALTMVDRIALLLQHEKVDAVFVLQPMLIMERGRTGMPAVEKQLLDFNVKSYLPNYEAFMRQAVPLVSAMTRKTVEGNGAMFLDATNVFATAQGQVFTDYVHLTPQANQVLATFVANNIQCRISARLHTTSVPFTGEGEPHRSNTQRPNLRPCQPESRPQAGARSDG